MRPQRKKMRLPNWDYATPGLYFVTFCTHGRRNVLARIVASGQGAMAEPEVQLSSFGCACRDIAGCLPSQYPGCCIELLTIMPNHVHALVSLSEASPPGCVPNLKKVMGSWKAQVTRAAHGNGWSGRFWQANFHDRIVRNEAERAEIWEYMENNPRRWLQDELYRA